MYRCNLSEKIHRQICLIDLILGDAEIPTRNLVTAMIVDLHKDDRRDLLLRPGHVAEGLAEAMAADSSLDPQLLRGRRDDLPCGHAADWLVLLSPVAEDEVARVLRKVQFQRMSGLRIEGEGLLLPCLALGQMHMSTETLAFEIIYIGPAEVQEVADPERSAGTHDNHHIITKLALLQEEVGEFF